MKQIEIFLQETDKKSVMLEKTLSACSTCLKLVDSNIVERDGKVYLEKECCSKEVGLLENDANFYKENILAFRDEASGLTFGQKLSDLEVKRKLIDNASVLSLAINIKCNLQCPICYLNIGPKTGNMTNEKFPEMTLDEIKFMLKDQKRKLVCLIGGEPTLRKDIFDIIKFVKESGNTPLINTHGLALLDKEYVKKLKKSGLSFLQMWFDSFNDDTYLKLRGGKFLYSRSKILKNLKDERVPVRLVSVIGKGINDYEIPNIVRFAMKNNDFIKGINFDSLYTGAQILPESTTTSDILNVLGESFGTGREYWIENKKFRKNVLSLIAEVFGSKLEKNFERLRTNCIWLMKKNEIIQPAFSIDELKKFNQKIEKTGRMIGLPKRLTEFFELAKLVFKPEIRPLIYALIFNKLNIPKASQKLPLLSINIINVGSTINRDFGIIGDVQEVSILTLMTRNDE